MADRKINLFMAFRAIDRVTRPVQRMGAAVQRFTSRTGLDRVGRNVARLGRSMGDVGTAALAMGRRLALAGGVFGGAAFGATGHFAKWADNLVKTAKRLGISTDALQRWRYAANLSGVSAETLDMAMQRFSRRAADAARGTGEAKDAFRNLGIDLYDEAGKMRDTETLFLEVMDALKRTSETHGTAVRNAIAKMFFDSEGVSLVQLGGAAEIKAMGDELAAAGQIKPFEELQRGVDHLDNLTRLKTALHDLTLTLGSELLPHMDRMVKKLTEWIQKAKPNIVAEIQKAFADLGAVLDWIGNAFGRIGEAVGAFLDWLETTHPAVADFVRGLRHGAEEMGAFRLIVGGIIAWLGARFAIALAGSLISMGLLVTSFITFVGKSLAATAVFLAKNPIVLLAAAVIGAAYLIYEHWREIPGFFKGVWEDIKAWFLTPFGAWDKAIADAVLRAWTAVVDGLAALPAWFGGIWDQVTAAFDIAGWIAELRTWSLTATMQGWVAGVVSWFQRTWSSVVSAFDIAGWIAELRTWSLTATMQGWVAGVVSWFQRTWSSVVFAFDIAGWIAELRTWSLTATMQGWVAGVVSWFQRTWSSVVSAFDIAGWIAELRTWSLTATVKGWFAGALTWVAGWWRDLSAAIGIEALIGGLAGYTLAPTIRGWFAGALAWVQGFWADIRYAVGIDRLVTWMNTWDFDVLSAIKGWFGGVVPWIRKTWAEIRSAIGIEALIEWLEGFSLWNTAMAWIDSLWAGVVAGWGQFVAWFTGAIDDALGPFKWALRQVGILPDEDQTPTFNAANDDAIPARVRALAEGGGLAQGAAVASPFAAPAVPSAIGPGSAALRGGASPQQIAEIVRIVVGGTVRIGFENPPAGMRVRSIRSDNPDVDIDVTAGYALAGS